MESFGLRMCDWGWKRELEIVNSLRGVDVGFVAAGGVVEGVGRAGA